MSGASRSTPPHKSQKNVLNVTILKVFRNELDPPFQCAVQGFKHTRLGSSNIHAQGVQTCTPRVLKHAYKLRKHTYMFGINTYIHARGFSNIHTCLVYIHVRRVPKDMRLPFANMLQCRHALSEVEHVRKQLDEYVLFVHTQLSE